jgi:uncharacterized surface protein with fasciclin (FAS1) repeats
MGCTARLQRETLPMKKTILMLAVTVLFGCEKEAAPVAGGSASAATATPPAPAAAEENKIPTDPQNIVNIAANSKDHSTLVTALKAADYIDSVSNPGPITVFAPTNAAFEKLPKGTVEGLLKPEKADDLRNILKYHVVPSSYFAKDLTDGTSLGMINGKATIHVKDGKTMINDATILSTIKASNGVIHVIDGVLLPPAAK